MERNVIKSMLLELIGNIIIRTCLSRMYWNIPKDEGVNVFKKDSNRQFLLKMPIPYYWGEKRNIHLTKNVDLQTFIGAKL